MASQRNGIKGGVCSSRTPRTKRKTCIYLVRATQGAHTPSNILRFVIAADAHEIVDHIPFASISTVVLPAASTFEIGAKS